MKPLYLMISVLLALSLKSQSNYEITKKSNYGTPSFVKFNSESGINHLNFMIKMKDEFGFRTEDELYLNKTEIDKLGFTHYRYKQKYKDLFVDGGDIYFHEKNNSATSLNGLFIPNINLDITPKLTKDEAVKSATKSLGLSKYRWEDEKSEAALKKRTKNPAATHYPKPQLIIYPKNGEFKLCYKFDVAGASLNKAWTVIIDANTGEMIKKKSLVHNDTPATAQTYYNGVKPITSYYDSGSGYYLLAETQRGILSSQEIYTMDANNDSLPDLGGDVWNTSQYIGSTSTSFTNDPVANNVHWGIEKAYDFYALFGRNSFDNNGTYIINLVHYMTDYNNAFWSSYDTVMCYGDGDGVEMDYLVGLDVGGHEFTHAITSTTADLQYEMESGALNESFSDIFGCGIEYYALGNNNWTIGEDVMLQTNFLRSMSNPHDSEQPRTYGANDTFWQNSNCGTPDEANDYCGVHTNSGVQNYWFYLLSQGGSGFNENGDYYSVAGIGINDALNVAYRNLSVYLSPNSDYNDARMGSIVSATDFWGAGSSQVNSVMDAWCAVGVGTCSSVGIKTISSSAVSVFPNPSTEKITVISDFSIDEIKVINSLGQEVKNFVFNSNSFSQTIELSDLNDGMYFIQIDSVKNSVTKKIFLNRK